MGIKDKQKEWDKAQDERVSVPHFDDRKCRDVFWLLVFVAFLVGLSIIAVFAFKNGDYRRIVNGVDYRGCTCGTQVIFNRTAAETPTDDDRICIESDLGEKLGKKSVFVQFFDTVKYGSDPVIW